MPSDWSFSASHRIHARLTVLTQARRTARTSVRVAPRRMTMRASVEAEERRVSRMCLLAIAVMGLVRTVMELGELGAATPPGCDAEIDELAGAIQQLLDAPHPWPRTSVEQVRATLDALVARPLPRESPASPASAIVTTAIRAVAGDVLRLVPDAQVHG